VSRAAALIVLERAAAERELGTVRAWLESAAAPAAGVDGAIVVAGLAGEATALGRWQRAGGSGAEPEVRRLTGGRSTQYGDGIVSLCAVAPSPLAWIDERGPLSGPRLLNRWVRGLLAGLAAIGAPAAYLGRDFVSVRGRRVAAVSLERSAADRVLFQAVIGAARPYATAEREPRSARLPPLPEPTSLEREGADPGALRALAVGCARRWGLALVEAAPPEPLPVLPAAEAPAGVSAGPVPIPIGELEAFVCLAPDGTLSRVSLRGDWIAGSAAVALLESGLVGRRAEEPALLGLIERWLGLPATLAVGLTDARAIAEAVRRSAAAAAAQRSSA
jgi:hypothetical protein